MFRGRFRFRLRSRFRFRFRVRVKDRVPFRVRFRNCVRGLPDNSSPLPTRRRCVNATGCGTSPPLGSAGHYEAVSPYMLVRVAVTVSVTSDRRRILTC